MTLKARLARVAAILVLAVTGLVAVAVPSFADTVPSSTATTASVGGCVSAVLTYAENVKAMSPASSTQSVALATGKAVLAGKITACNGLTAAQVDSALATAYAQYAGSVATATMSPAVVACETALLSYAQAHGVLATVSALVAKSFPACTGLTAVQVANAAQAAYIKLVAVTPTPTASATATATAPATGGGTGPGAGWAIGAGVLVLLIAAGGVTVLVARSHRPS